MTNETSKLIFKRKYVNSCVQNFRDGHSCVNKPEIYRI